MLRVLTLYLVLQFVSGFAYACDPHENCRKCLVSAFGKCKVRGNDPVCEARKAKCQKIPFEIPGDPFASGGPLGKGGPGLPGVPGEELKKCISDPQSCPGKILSAAAYQQLRAIMGNYFASLDQQASGHWRSFTDAFVRDVQPFYEVDLRAVRFATGINTGHGAAVTYGNRIYFPRQIDLNYRDDLMWMLHELEHVVQYKRRGGVDPMLGEYVAKHVGKILQTKRINVHDLHDMEQAADAKAANTIRPIYGLNVRVTNPCPFDVDVALSYEDMGSQYGAEGYWRYSPGESSILSDEDDVPIHTRNRLVYFYAEASGGTAVWQGNQRLVVAQDNRSLLFLEVRPGDDGKALGIRLTCP